MTKLNKLYPFAFVLFTCVIMSIDHGFKIEYAIYATTSVGFYLIWDMWRKHD